MFAFWMIFVGRSAVGAYPYGLVACIPCGRVCVAAGVVGGFGRYAIMFQTSRQM